MDKEPDAAVYAEAIAEAGLPLISTATLLELNIAMLNRHGAAVHPLYRLDCARMYPVQIDVDNAAMQVLIGFDGGG